MEQRFDPQKMQVGVVGLGLMGCSITTCLLMAGHSVVAVAPVKDDLIISLSNLRSRRIMDCCPPADW
jgi:3-hydroxybutyryl-CoA dehydrogenase